MSSDRLRRWILTAFVLLAAFFLETSLLPWLIPPEWRNGWSVYPKLVFACTVYISIFANRYAGGGFALAAGLLQDVMFYGHMIGANAFACALSAYAAGIVPRPKAVRAVFVFPVLFASLLACEIVTYALYRLFSLTDAEFGWMFMNGMLPSTLAGFLAAAALYVPARRWLEPPRSEQEPRKGKE